VTLAAGEELDVVVRHDVEPGIETTAIALGADPPHPGDDAGIEQAAALAAACDVAVVVVGTTE
jgi:beta-glucosidase